MSDPKSEGQPDTYGGTNWKTIECGTPHKQMTTVRAHKQRCLKPLVLHFDDRSQEQMTLEIL
jgi:hypothetical protein